MTSTNAMDQAFEEFEKECAGNREMRRAMIQKLHDVAMKMEIHPEFEKAMTLQAKLMIPKTIDDLLKSDENASLQKLKLKLARKDAETNGAVGTAVVELLKMVHVNEHQQGAVAAKPDSQQITDTIEAKCKVLSEGDEKAKKALAISEGELTKCEGGPTSDAGAEKAAAVAIDEDEAEKE